MKKLLLKYGLIVVVMTLLNIVISTIFGSVLIKSHFLWELLSNILILIAIGYYITNSNLNGIKLSLSVFAIFYVIGYFNILDEALLFNVTDSKETINLMIKGFIVVLFISPFFVYLLNKWSSKFQHLKFKKRTIFGWVWRIILCDILYLFFYIIAGLILQKVYPVFMDFYKDKIPSFSLIINVQFLRGFVFVGIAILILRTLNFPLIKKAMLIGIIFSILGGVAPLIPPNEFMPLYVRLGHGFEVGISNFLYGLLIGYILDQKYINE